MRYTQKERLRILRETISLLKYHKITQKQFAQWLGVSYCCLSDWANERYGREVPSYIDHSLEKIQNAYKEKKDLSTLNFPPNEKQARKISK